VLLGVTQATLILLVAQIWFCIPLAAPFVTLYTALVLIRAGCGRDWAPGIVGRRHYGAGDAVHPVRSYQDQIAKHNFSRIEPTYLAADLRAW
jgi:hypothetical protein